MRTKRDNPTWLRGYEAGHGDALFELSPVFKAVREMVDASLVSTLDSASVDLVRAEMKKRGLLP